MHIYEKNITYTKLHFLFIVILHESLNANDENKSAILNKNQLSYRIYIYIYIYIYMHVTE